MRKSAWLTALAGVPLLFTALLPPAPASALAPVQVIVDGKALTLDPAPIIVGDRTLVPLRGVFEAMNSTVTWNEADRSVEVTRDDQYVRLKIDRRLACLDYDCLDAATLDVPARIIGDRTFVPVRFLSQAVGAKVSWDNDRRAVIIETDQQPDYAFPAPQIATLMKYQQISGPVPLRLEGTEGTYVQYYLIDPATEKGPMIAAGSDPSATYTFTPDPTVTGTRLLIAGVRDAAGHWRYSDPMNVLMAPKPAPRVTGIDWNGLVDGPITFGNDVNFASSHITYRLIDVGTGSTENLATLGAGDNLTWYPQVGHNGSKRLQVVAFDRFGNSYPSEQIPIRVQSGYRTSFSGIREGQVLGGPTSLSVNTNFSIKSVQYLIDDKHLAWGTSHWWNFGPEMNGNHTLKVIITAQDGEVRTIGPINFRIETQPRIWLSGVGPNQVVTGTVSPQTGSNVSPTSISYYLTDPATGQSTLLGRTGLWEKMEWTPAPGQDGARVIHAVANDLSGTMLSTDRINLRVFLGTVYGPKPIVPQKDFKAFASAMAVPAYRETGMSAALQVAQAILETGWGQYIPVDKYDGQMSNNLFGIKGTGSAGSVISNTWEEYNGVAYRVDDSFRAYNNIVESWADHKDLLLTRSWYAPFRAVMADPVMGAWGLRRSGYATDSQYPVKLIQIMRENDLFKLDDIEL